jgi:hypothetical protein
MAVECENIDTRLLGVIAAFGIDFSAIGTALESENIDTRLLAEIEVILGEDFSVAANCKALAGIAAECANMDIRFSGEIAAFLGIFSGADKGG